MIRYSEARAPFSLVEVIRHYALPLLVIGLVIIATIVIVFLRYRRQVNLFNKHQAAAREALQTALDAADNASAAKTSFLSNMSHDIRTAAQCDHRHGPLLQGANINDTNRVKDCFGEDLLFGQAPVVPDQRDIGCVEDRIGAHRTFRGAVRSFRDAEGSG